MNTVIDNCTTLLINMAKFKRYTFHVKHSKVQKIHWRVSHETILSDKNEVAQLKIYSKYVNYDICVLLKNCVKYDDNSVKNNKNCV